MSTANGMNGKYMVVPPRGKASGYVCDIKAHIKLCRGAHRLFMEMYKAFKLGRSEKNPADFWAKGEIGFFDFYMYVLLA